VIVDASDPGTLGRHGAIARALQEHNKLIALVMPHQRHLPSQWDDYQVLHTFVCRDSEAQVPFAGPVCKPPTYGTVENMAEQIATLLADPV